MKAKELLHEIEELEARIANPAGFTQQEVSNMVHARVAYIGQLADLTRAHNGETDAEMLRRMAHDNGGAPLGLYDSAHTDSSFNQETSKAELLQFTRQRYGDEAMANVEHTMHNEA